MKDNSFSDMHYQIFMTIKGLIGEGKLNEANQETLKLLEENPGIPEFLNLHAEIKYQMGDIEEAKTLLKETLGIDPVFSDALNNIGVILWKEGKQKEALDYIRKALIENPEDKNTILNLGEMLTDLKKFKEARNLYLSYLKSNPDDAEFIAALSAIDALIKPKTGYGDMSEKELKDNILTGYDYKGVVYDLGDFILRRIYPEHFEHTAEIFRLIKSGDLERFGIVETEIDHHNNALKHRKYPVSYPYEWTPNMFKDALIHHMNIVEELDRFDMTLLDALPSNILFDFYQPVFIDFLSVTWIEMLKSEIWLTNGKQYTDERLAIVEKMFIPFMLIPFIAMAERNYDLSKKLLSEKACNVGGGTPHLSDIYKDPQGIMPQNVFDSLNKITEAFSNDHKLYNILQDSILIKQNLSLEKRANFDYITKILRDLIVNTDVTPFTSAYSSYYIDKNEDFSFVDKTQWKNKQKIIYDIIKEMQPKRVLDIGANTGWFSILAERLGAEVISTDIDASSIDSLYLLAKNNNLKILPLHMSFDDFTKTIFGEHNQDPIYQDRDFLNKPLFRPATARLQSDLVLSLGLLHHLILGMGMSLNEVFEILSKLTKKTLILEFTDINDELIQGEPSFFPNLGKYNLQTYNIDLTIKEGMKHFASYDILDSHPVSRKMLVFRKDSSEFIKQNIDRVDETAKNAEKKQFISVIISASNKSKILDKTVTSFIDQDYPKDSYEVIVVDNHSDKIKKSIIDELSQSSKFTIRYKSEIKPGMQNARNTGAYEAKGNILYFTDAGMIAEKNLLTKLSDIFVLDQNIAFATGKVIPQWESPPPGWILNYFNNNVYSLFDLGDEIKIFNSDPGMLEHHLAVKKEVFFNNDGFQPDVSNYNGPGEDKTTLSKKINRSGFKFAYSGRVITKHFITNDLMTQDYVNKRYAYLGRFDGISDFRENQYVPKTLLNNIAKFGDSLSTSLNNYINNRNRSNPEWRLDRSNIDYIRNRIDINLKLAKDQDLKAFILKDKLHFADKIDESRIITKTHDIKKPQEKLPVKEADPVQKIVYNEDDLSIQKDRNLPFYNTQTAQRQLFFYYQLLKSNKTQLPNFRDTGFRCFSQIDEDGILVYIFSIIGFTNKILVDMAFADPYGANTTNLICNWGFHGLLVEGNQQGVEKSIGFFSHHPDTFIYPPTVQNHWITAENANDIIIENGIKGEIDLFALDIDGIDYWLLKNLKVINPRVIIVEAAAFLGRELSITVPYDPKFNRFDYDPDYFSASIRAFIKLGHEKGYRLVACNRFGFNLFFVRNDLGADCLKEISADDCFYFEPAELKRKREERMRNVLRFKWVEV